MAWNESGNGQDPWGNNNRRRKAPNDLDKMLGNFQRKVSAAFGGKGDDDGSADGLNTLPQVSNLISTYILNDSCDHTDIVHINR